MNRVSHPQPRPDVRPDVLPSAPRVLALVLAEFAQAQPRLQQLALHLRADPALTWRLLQAANAPERGLSGQVLTVSEALALLGLTQVRTMVEEALAALSLQAVPGVDLPTFWRYSVDVARYARALARTVRQNQGAAYTCGLIHALGELTLHLQSPDEAARLGAEVGVFDLRRVRAEQRHWGRCYAEVGAEQARRHHLPAVLVDALQFQHAPFDNEAYEPLAGVVHLAVWRARSALAGLSERAQAASFPGSVGEVLGLDIDMVLQQDPFDWFAHT